MNPIYTRWSAEEDAKLRQYHCQERKSAPVCASLLGRTLAATRSRIRKLGLKNPKDLWTEDEIAAMAAYPAVMATEIAKRLGRSVGAVRQMAHRLGLTESYGTNSKCRVELTVEQLGTLRREFPHVANSILARVLGISERTLSRKAKKLGLQKTKEFMRECHAYTAAKAKASHLRNGTYPPKGVVNDNLAKGVKYRYEKGHKPANAKI